MIRTALIALSVLMLAAAEVFAEAPKLEGKKIYSLWEGKAPGQREHNPANKGEKPEDHVPVVQAFLPGDQGAKATGSSIVVCPGGGYGGLAAHEGPVIGEWLAKNGVTAFVLRYRLGSKGYHHPIEMTDATRAVRFVRHYSKDWGLDGGRVGILGFSAGGHLASTVATHWDEGHGKAKASDESASPVTDAGDAVDAVSSRPDVQVLIYPVVTMAPNTKTGGGHDGSRNNLLGKAKAGDAALIGQLSNEKRVNARTPPAFLVHGVDDKAVPVSNSDDYAAALKKAGVGVEYVRPENGPHGFGLKDFWGPKCIEWLRGQKF